MPTMPPPPVGGGKAFAGAPGVSRPSQLSPPPPLLGGPVGAMFGAPAQQQFGAVPQQQQQQQQYGAATQQAYQTQAQSAYPPSAGVPGAAPGDAGQAGNLVEEFQSLTLSLAPGSAEAAVDPSALPRPQVSTTLLGYCCQQVTWLLLSIRLHVLHLLVWLTTQMV